MGKRVFTIDARDTETQSREITDKGAMNYLIIDRNGRKRPLIRVPAEPNPPTRSEIIISTPLPPPNEGIRDRIKKLHKNFGLNQADKRELINSNKTPDLNMPKRI